MDKNKASEMARDLLEFHKLYAWRIVFDRAVRRFGQCRYGSKTIKLSAALVALNNEAQVLDCILHEIAHALTPRDRGHDSEWQHVAKDIGCNGERCYDNTVVLPSAPWLGECPACHRIISRFRRKRISCGVCCNGVFNSAYLFVWKRG
jgi:predicted SprT family Zn-dependent metalloprotease